MAHSMRIPSLADLLKQPLCDPSLGCNGAGHVDNAAVLDAMFEKSTWALLGQTGLQDKMNHLSDMDQQDRGRL